MSENSAGPGEPVRLPGIIHIEEEDINCKLNMLTVDTSDIGQSRFKQKPSWMSPYSRSESAETRQRKRSRDCLVKMGGSRVRSASAGRDKRTEMACRYWAILVENLKRAVDDLYNTCEGDESCMYAREVIMILDNYSKDFNSLVTWLKLKVEYENTAPPQRPTSLTWDIRKTSPMGKVTPVSTPGKLTPTRQLLLVSPAKRQLEFSQTDGEAVLGRTRQVSETIKEVGLETDFSPHQSWQDLQGGREQEEISSEHEKSDSEQEKDAAATPLVETEEKETNADEMTQSTESAISETEPTSKSSSSTDLSQCPAQDKKNVPKAKTKSGVKVKTVTEKGGKSSKVVSSDKVSKTTEKSNNNTVKASQSLTAPTASTTAKSQQASSGPAACKREKSEDKAKSQVKITSTFASKVKAVPKTVVSSSGPRMTRAKTSITSITASTSKLSSATSRKTAAGLLITTTATTAGKTNKPLPASSKSSQTKTGGAITVTPAPPPPPGSSSPKQQRISLVARQSMFASEKKNPNRKLSRTESSKSSRPSTAPSGGKPGGEGDENRNRLNPATTTGSNTSLSSGSSSRSWADTVRAGLTHLSVEDLSLNLGRTRHGSVVDSDGWCTVRRSRARFSPISSSNNSVKARPGAVTISHRAKNRFKMPSSAISMPSLAFSQSDSASPESSGKPVLERSSTSASIIRNRRDKAQHLDKVVEKAGGSSNESLENSDSAAKLKAKKDQINLTKKEALRRALSNEETEKQKVWKVCSLPEPLTTSVTGEEEEEDLGTSVSDEADMENEEIKIREKAIAEAEMEVSNLQKEIKETEQSELTDTDCDNDADSNDTRSEAGTISDVSSKYESLLEGLSWSEQMELEEQLGESSSYETRLPGRAIQLHDKLSSPARSREAHTLQHCQEKQDRARLRRLRFAEEKSHKLANLKQRTAELIDKKDKLVDEMKDIIELKLKKAEERRCQHIEEIRKKAHKEEEKLKEIAFINELQAQNNRLDIIYQVDHAEENCSERLAEKAEERAKKAEQREEREAKAEERRKMMEAERLNKKTALLERRREREERIQEEQAAARQQRKVSAAIRDRERLERLSTVRAAEQDMKEELQGKIQQKQEDAAKRHAEYLEDIRQKAWEMSLNSCSSDEKVPMITNYQVQKKCEICNVFIKSEVHLASHLRGKQHQEEISKKADRKDLSEAEKKTYNLKHIVDAPEGETDPKSVLSKERVKNAKKKAKKIKSKMASKAAEYISSLAAPNKHLDSPNRARIGKSLREIEKLLSSQGKGAWPNNSVSALERAFGEISRAFEKNSSKDQDVFRALGGFETLEKIYLMLSECGGGNTCVIPMKSLVSAGRVLVGAAQSHAANTEFVLLSNRLTLIVDILLDRLARLTPEQPRPEEMRVPGPDPDPVSQSLMLLLSTVIQFLSGLGSVSQTVVSRLQDVVSYIVCSGTVDSLASYFQLVRDPIDNSPEVAEFLLTALQLLTSLTSAIERGQDPSHLLLALQGTELGGTVSMLYGMLLHQGRDCDRDRDSVPSQLPPHTLAVSIEACTLLHRLVRDHQVQTVLSSEGISLEFRHIASYLLYYCQHHNQSVLLNLVIVLVGYFTANHPDNQSIVQSGSQPSVLQQLANLPFPYFSQPALKAVLFPSLLSCCHNNAVNMAILSQEMSWKLIEDFVKSEEGQKNVLVTLVTGGGSKQQ